MNLNKFLITENSDAEPVNSQFSGIFKKSSVPITNQFLVPNASNINHIFQHRNSDYEDSSFNRISGSLDNFERETLKRVSQKYKVGNITFKRNLDDSMNVIHYDVNQQLLINHVGIEDTFVSWLS